jgi:lysozyme
MQIDSRMGIGALVLSAAALVGIALDEGYSERAYPDPVHGAKVATIGFGSTQGVNLGDVITPTMALQRISRDVQVFEGALKRCVHVPLHQYEYDAYVNLAYNIGSGAFCGSTLVKRLNALDYPGACNAILMWRMVGKVDCSEPGNKKCTGLWARRQRLQRQCLGQSKP